MSEAHYVYVIGHEHATFGHALKIGISSNVIARMATLQTGNPDELKLFFTLRFDSRATAQEIERLFHESEIAGPVRGEWVGCDPTEAIYYLASIASHVLRRTYGEPVAPTIKEATGLARAFDVCRESVTVEWQGNVVDWLDFQDEIRATQ